MRACRVAERIESLRLKNLLMSIMAYLFFGFMHDAFGMLVVWILMGISMVLAEPEEVGRKNGDDNAFDVGNSG